MEGLDEVSDSKFSLQNQKFMLTYKTHLDKEKYIKWFGRDPKFIRLAHEMGDSSNNYPHTHVLIDMGKRFQSKNCRVFDYKGIHPNIKLIKTSTHWYNSVQYMAKEDIENADLKMTMTDKILCCDSLKEAIDRNAMKVNDAVGIKMIYDLKGDKGNFCKKEVNLVRHPWMDKIDDIVEKGSDYRSIHWVFDEVGNSGKTNWIKYNMVNHPGDFFAVKSTGMIRDFAQILRNALEGGWAAKCAVFDLPRNYGDRSAIYEALEIMIDGICTSTKYSGLTITFDSPVVIVLANFRPQMEYMSMDRWKEYHMTEDKDLIMMNTQHPHSMATPFSHAGVGGDPYGVFPLRGNAIP